MKKRFTIMLEETTIFAIKKLAALKSPTYHREDLERVIWEYVTEELKYYGNK